MHRCDCCDSAPARVLLRALTGENVSWSARLCAPCLRWLEDVVTAARDGVPQLIGSPTANGRALLFDNQCRLCRRIAPEPHRALECRTPGGARIPFPHLRLCLACDAWLASLAGDGRSPRNLRARDAEGAYGNWLHPNLRSLSVAVEIADRDARRMVFESCERMGVAASPLGAEEQVDVALFEVPSRALRRNERPDAPQVLLAPLTARTELLASLGPRVLDWLTIPVTPQQVAASLTRVLLLRGRPRQWDRGAGLPLLVPLEPMPPALSVEPAPGVEPFEVAWLLRRFARGYDDIGVLAGELVLVPRAPAGRLEDVAARLGALLRGRATVKPLDFSSHASRLHASG